MWLAVALIVVTAASAGAQEKSYTERMMEAYERGQASRVRKSEAELNEARAKLAAMETEAIRQQTERMQAQAAAEAKAATPEPAAPTPEQIAEHERLGAALAALHPDWKEYQPQMLALARKLQPAPDTGRLEYLRLLYGLSKAVESTRPVKDVLAEARQ